MPFDRIVQRVFLRKLRATVAAIRKVGNDLLALAGGQLVAT